MSLSSAAQRHCFLVAKRMLEGAVVPFLGAGANLCGRPDTPWEAGSEFLPSSAELAAKLAGEVHYPDPDDRDLMRISQYVHSVLGWQPLYQYVRAPLDPLSPPTVLHLFLARMARLLRERSVPRQVILTTNYDDTLERAFSAVGEPYDLIWYEAQSERPDCGRFIHDRAPEPVPILLPNQYVDLDPDQRTVIVKLHGAMVRADAARDSYVITEDDYIHYLTRSDIAVELPAVLRQRITERHLLFLGYSMRDWNLRVVLERLAGSGVLANQSWSVQREPPTPAATEIELTLWSDRDVDLVFMLLDEYVDELDRQLASLAKSVSSPAPGPPRQNPYVGLLPFGEGDVPWFFGRDRERQIIGANLRSSRLTLALRRERRRQELAAAGRGPPGPPRGRGERSGGARGRRPADPRAGALRRVDVRRVARRAAAGPDEPPSRRPCTRPRARRWRRGRPAPRCATPWPAGSGA